MSDVHMPSNGKFCGTCVHWCGRQIPNVNATVITFDNSERARCIGGGLNNVPILSLQSCAQWEQRFGK